ncbi:MAG: SCO family protein [Cytophagales bacterium]
MNKNIFKIGMLVILLVLPIFVFLFLKTFGVNHFGLITYYPIEFKERNVGGKTVVDTIFHQVPDFKLINQEADSINKGQLQNKIIIADFFFTRCPGICPIITSNLSKVQEAFIDDKDVMMLSISVDAEFDRPDILLKYQEKFNIDGKKWFLATGDRDEIYKLGFYGFKLPADTIDKTLHSEKVVLLDKDRHIRGYYTGTDKVEIDRLITEAKILQHEYKLAE